MDWTSAAFWAYWNTDIFTMQNQEFIEDDPIFFRQLLLQLKLGLVRMTS
jgi:hypothetical protein